MNTQIHKAIFVNSISLSQHTFKSTKSSLIKNDETAEICPFETIWFCTGIFGIIPTRKYIFNMGYLEWFLVRFCGCFYAVLSPLSPLYLQSVVKSVVTCRLILREVHLLLHHACIRLPKIQNIRLLQLL